MIKTYPFLNLLSIQRAVGTRWVDGQNVLEPVVQEQTAESDLVQEMDVQEHTKKKNCDSPSCSGSFQFKNITFIRNIKICIFSTGLFFVLLVYSKAF